MNADEIVSLVRRRIESRYRRLLFVHQELEKLNALAKLEPSAKTTGDNTLSNRSFEDFVFSRINFSIYKKIDTEEFTLLFCDGLQDYEDAFYTNFFSMSREEVRKTINGSYVRAGPFYLCKKSSHLLLSIMRTMHTSLDFAPLLGADDIADRDQLKAVAGVLDGLVIRHDDGMETKLFIPQAADPNMQDMALLCGTFHPLGKACTVTLIP